ncbi:MAG: DUF5799 family protein [Halobacteriaceae archaeon]
MANGSRAWLDRVAGERMEFDREFSEVVAESPFTNQQWGLVMTAANFRIENPARPEEAELVPETDRLPAVMGEVENLDSDPARPGGGGGGGIVDSLRDRLGVGSGGDDELVDAAEELLEEYASGFQERLVAAGRWEEVCEIAAGE